MATTPASPNGDSRPPRSWSIPLLAASVLVTSAAVAGVVALTRSDTGEANDPAGVADPTSTISQADQAAGPRVTETDSDTTGPDPIEQAPVGGDGVLTYGGLLPASGQLELFHPAMEAAAELAIGDINDAGGVFASPVQWLDGNSGTDSSVAAVTVDRHLESGVDAVIGAASDSVSYSVLERIAEGGALQVSPANGWVLLTEPFAPGRYYRTAASDAIEGRALGELLIADGAETAAFLAVNDGYGANVLRAAEARFGELGGEVVVSELYVANATTFFVESDIVVDSNPDAIVIIGYEESAVFLAALANRGMGPAERLVYGTEGNVELLAGAVADPASLDGMRATVRGVDVFSEQPGFVDRLATTRQGSSLANYQFAAETYDAVVLVALAALAAGVDDAELISDQIAPVTTTGTVCTSFSACAVLLAAGTDIDYEGVSGPLDINRNGDRVQAPILVAEFDRAGETAIADSILGSLP